MNTVWLDAVEFKNKGGWKTESQFVRSVGQAYLIAVDKPGQPVESATTDFKLEEDGRYRIFVRAKNWRLPEAPGKFTVSVDGVELPNILGKMPTQKWYWEIAGDLLLSSGKHEIAVNDKTGWLSRFAAIVITKDMDFTPSPEPERLLKQRAEIKCISLKEKELHFDCVVVGAGASGVPAAIEAARNGLKTALISGRPTIGGNASGEGTIGFDGAASKHRNMWEGGIANQIRNLHIVKKLPWQAALEQLCEGEENLTVFTKELCIDAHSEKGKIIYATTVNTDTLIRTRFFAPYFCDCSGDGWLGYYAGAAYRVGREAKADYDEAFAPEFPDTLTMSGCLCDKQKAMPKIRIFSAKETENKVPFTAPEWAIALPEGAALCRKAQSLSRAEWWLENSNDHDDLWDDEFSRDEMVRLGVGYFHWLKNSAPLSAELAEKIDYYELCGIALHNSKRENRRLIGDYVFNQNDCVEGKHFDDAISYCGWNIDVHNVKGIYSGAEGPFHSNTLIPLTPLPYRILYSKNVDNLFIGGRCCSVSHVGLGTVRVESTLATLGQAIGAAAFICSKYCITPREVYKHHIKELQQLLIRHDLTIPEVYNEDEEDLARSSTVTADSVAENFYILKGDGTKDLWKPIEAETLYGPAAPVQPEYVKAELKNPTDNDAKLIAKLWEYNNRDDIDETARIIEVCEITVKGGFEGWFTIPFTLKNKQNCFALSFEASDDVLWRRRAWVWDTITSFTKRDGKLIRTHNEGRELNYGSMAEQIADCSPENVINGKNRQTVEALNCWVSDEAKGLPASITLTLAKEEVISEVRASTYVDLSYPKYCFMPFPTFTGTAEEVAVSILHNGNWKEVYRVKDNCFKQIVARFEGQEATAVKITVYKTINSNSAFINEVRIYK